MDEAGFIEAGGGVGVEMVAVAGLGFELVAIRGDVPALTTVGAADEIDGLGGDEGAGRVGVHEVEDFETMRWGDLEHPAWASSG